MLAPDQELTEPTELLKFRESRGLVLSRLRRDIADDGAWLQNDLVQEYMVPNGLRKLLISRRLLTDGTVEMLMVWKSCGRDFRDVDSSALLFLHRAIQLTPADEIAPAVSWAGESRSETILEFLLKGWSSKRIADTVGMSTCSVRACEALLYQRYRVANAAELTALMHALPRALGVVGSQMHLSARQKETLWWLGSGAPERDISLAMGISFHTVHQYVKALYSIFKVSSRIELLAKVISLGSFENRVG
jgi:DNA-binding NarL/FixJ family response regulator